MPLRRVCVYHVVCACLWLCVHHVCAQTLDVKLSPLSGRGVMHGVLSTTNNSIRMIDGRYVNRLSI